MSNRRSSYLIRVILLTAFLSAPYVVIGIGWALDPRLDPLPGRFGYVMSRFGKRTPFPDGWGDWPLWNDKFVISCGLLSTEYSFQDPETGETNPPEPAMTSTENRTPFVIGDRIWFVRMKDMAEFVHGEFKMTELRTSHKRRRPAYSPNKAVPITNIPNEAGSGTAADD